MGAILGALLGRQLAHAEDRYNATRDWVLAPIVDRQKNPTSPNYTNEELDRAIKAGFEKGFLDKHMKHQMDAGFDKLKKVWQAARDQELSDRALSAVQANTPVDMGRPLANPSATPPVQPQLPPPPAAGSPDAIRAGAGGAAPAPQGPDASAMVQRLLPLMMAANQPQGGMQGSMQGGPPPGPGTPPPFANGPMAAGASGPVQQGENPQMAQAAVKGSEGYGTPPPAAAPKPTLPKPPYYADTFGGGGMDPAEYAARKGRAEAITARPGIEQANELARENQAKVYQQTQAQKIAEQQRMLDLVTATDEFKKAPSLQQLEIRARIMGMQGAITSPRALLNLSKSAIPNSEFPEGTLDSYGRELDRSPGKWSFQQQDPNTNEIRAVATTPNMTTTKLWTNAGIVLIKQDPRGTITSVTKEVDGSPITDPALLETVRNAVENRTLITVDEKGRPTTSILQVPTQSKVQKTLPNQSPGAAPPAGAAAPAGTAAPGAPVRGRGGAVAPVATPRVIATAPRPLTAATQRTAEFAQSVQKHTDRIDSLIDQLDKDGKLGIVASRWNDFLAGKVGAGDPRFSALQTDLGMFATALGVAHQTKGIKIMEHFKEMADAGTLTADTLRSNFNELKSWIDTYAAMGSNRPGAVNTGGGGGAGAGAGKGGAMNNPPEKTYQWQSGGKTLKGTIPKADEAEFLQLHPEAKEINPVK